MDGINRGYRHYISSDGKFVSFKNKHNYGKVKQYKLFEIRRYGIRQEIKTKYPIIGWGSAKKVLGWYRNKNPSTKFYATSKY